MIDGKMTTDIHIPLWPELRQQIDDAARADAVKPATKARQLILAGLAVQQKSTQIEVQHG